jgi:transposase-like protein
MAMKPDEFQGLVAQVEKLTPHQLQRLAEQVRERRHRQAVHTVIESRAADNPLCPRCGHGPAARWGSASGLQRYRCPACHATFNALTGTPLARLRHKDKWLAYAQQLAEGHSVRNSARACEVHRNTAFRWRHRFLALPNGQKARRLGGIAEIDETFFLESFKGQKRGLPRAPRRRGGKAKKPGLSEEQIPVLICRDRLGRTADAVLERVDAAAVSVILKPLLEEDTLLCADGNPVYRKAARDLAVPLKAVNLRAGIRVRDKVFHIQNVNAYDSRLKSWMLRFHGVATHYLPNYLGWRRLIERLHRTPSPRHVLLAALGLPTQQLIVT